MKFSPDNQHAGPSRFDDIDVILQSLLFTTSDGTRYQKEGNKTVPLLIVKMFPDGGTEAFEQFFSCGDLENFKPSSDGETLEAVSDKAKEWGGIKKDCKAAIFLASLVQSGIPGEKLDSGKISDLAGIKCHVVNVAYKAVSGGKPTQAMTVNRIISVPWASNGAAAKLNGGATFGDSDLAKLAVDALMLKGSGMKKNELAQVMLSVVPGDAKASGGKSAKMWAVDRVVSDEFLKAQSRLHVNPEGLVEVIPF